MPLHIILEGSDKVGKTTIAKKLSELLEMPVIKMEDMPKFFKDNMQEQASEIFNKAIVQFAHTSFIMDRGYPSSLVYSAYFNRDHDLDYLIPIVRKLDARVYVLSVQPRKADELINQSDQSKIRELYDEHAKMYGWAVIDCTKKTPDQICEIIIKDINQWTQKISS